MSKSTETIILFPPDSQNPPIDLDLDKFMGTWHVTHSTLPLWKSRKDVTITYGLKTSLSDEVIKFDDIVEYRAKSDPPSSTRSRVVGIDTLMSSTATPHTQGTTPPSSKQAQTRYKWRGKGWLMIASSRWQLLGCSEDPSPGNAAAWAVTYFEKTLFTPAGLDIYSRTARGLPSEAVQEILGKVKELGGDVAKISEGFFELERSGVSSAGAMEGGDQGNLEVLDVNSA
ncbi:hypothetical protein L227DRAFT_572374 [Lentinus tigrinus ALCF2SS1-6]|uniref:Uncharacterized protein n=1 Tax=Lentinus tigrinus ALCF2SS1-6 TaxID=1328759 RepID=A0A5C2SKV9_9APHY|nr:hypothetical protein L227DRAFT_572374 [Lentinus tigrinus ALCF2SS1-6]